MPKFIIRKELANVSDQTTSAMETLLGKQATVESICTTRQHYVSIEQQRTNMAQTHVKLVETLEVALGREKAITLCREALFSVGQNLGRQTRSRLGVGDSSKDLTKAAKILYRVLGIEFHIEWLDKSNAQIIVDRCSLAQHYSKLTCEALSATDEGVIEGLQPNASMKFKEYMTSGCHKCRAEIHFCKKEQ